MNTLSNMNILNNGAAGEKKSININIMMKGWLAHDNRLFDRTCPQCGGMYSSYEVGYCTKCNTQLTFITTGKNKAMTISEGTFYPCLSTKQKESDLKSTQTKGNGIEATYRFKMFSFADDNGILAPPPAHGFCHKGNLVEIRIINHQPIYSLFTTGKGAAKAEIMFQVYDNYGDTVTFIKKAEVQNHTISHQVDAQGNPVPMAPVYKNAGNVAPAGVQALAQQLKEIQDKLAAIGAGAGQNPVTVEQNEVIETTAGSDDANPFAGAA